MPFLRLSIRCVGRFASHLTRRCRPIRDCGRQARGHRAERRPRLRDRPVKGSGGGGLRGRSEGAAAVLQLAQAEGGRFGLAAYLLAFQEPRLPALLPTFWTSQPKDLADHLHHAAGEIVDGDTSQGADLGNGALMKREGLRRGGDSAKRLGLQVPGSRAGHRAELRAR